jgi:hypothetical protein
MRHKNVTLPAKKKKLWQLKSNLWKYNIIILLAWSNFLLASICNCFYICCQHTAYSYYILLKQHLWFFDKLSRRGLASLCFHFAVCFQSNSSKRRSILFSLYFKDASFAIVCPKYYSLLKYILPRHSTI